MANCSILMSNIKGLLIVLVVLGHFMQCSLYVGKSEIGGDVYRFIYSFHMAAFIFVSGYFSKNIEKGYKDASRKYLLPYILMQLFTFGVKMLIYGKSSLNFLLPSYASWFLLTMFYFKVLLWHIVCWRYFLGVSFLLSILIGCVNENLMLMALGRSISFAPFFLLGYVTSEISIDKIRRLAHKYMFFIICGYIFAFRWLIYKYPSRRIFYFAESYSSFKLSMVDGMFAHTIVLLLGILAIILLIKYIPENECIFTQLGKNTLNIYFIHVFFFYLARKYQFLNTNTVYDWLSIFVYSFFVIWILSRRIVKSHFTDIINCLHNTLFRYHN